MSGPTLIKTLSLELIPNHPQHLLALYQGAEAYQRISGYRPAAGLADFYTSDSVRPEWFARLQAATEPDPWQFGFALMHPGTGTIIGAAGFVGTPGPDGVVEIAYAIVPEHQGKGYATEVAQALTSYAFASGHVRTVCAHTLPQPTASARVLTKSGFNRVADVIDPVDGLAWRWEKANPSPDHLTTW